MTGRDFAPGHELKAVQARIRQHFGGSALALIQWIDKTHEQPARHTGTAAPTHRQ